MRGMINIRWAVPMLAVALAASQAWDIGRSVRAKAAAQTAVVESILQWKQGVQAVAGAVQRWNKVYVAESEVQDLAGLLAQLRLDEAGLDVDADNVIVQAIHPEMHQNKEIGLTRVCLASAGAGESLIVQASDYKRLLHGLREVAARPQLHIGAITIHGEKAQAVARLADFCVLIRK